MNTTTVENKVPYPMEYTITVWRGQHVLPLGGGLLVVGVGVGGRGS